MGGYGGRDAGRSVGARVVRLAESGRAEGRRPRPAVSARRARRDAGRGTGGGWGAAELMGVVEAGLRFRAPLWPALLRVQPQPPSSSNIFGYTRTSTMRGPFIFLTTTS